jgi:phage baseplate assembly protein W
MTQLLSYPFRLDMSGHAITRDDTSDAYYAEELTMLILTHPGERVLQPDYGIDEPTFKTRFPTAELVMKTKIYGPNVHITNVDVDFERDGVADVNVEFDSRLDLLNY